MPSAAPPSVVGGGAGGAWWWWRRPPPPSLPLLELQPAASSDGDGGGADRDGSVPVVVTARPYPRIRGAVIDIARRVGVAQGRSDPIPHPAIGDERQQAPPMARPIEKPSPLARLGRCAAGAALIADVRCRSRAYDTIAGQRQSVSPAGLSARRRPTMARLVGRRDAPGRQVQRRRMAAARARDQMWWPAIGVVAEQRHRGVAHGEAVPLPRLGGGAEQVGDDRRVGAAVGHRHDAVDAVAVRPPAGPAASTSHRPGSSARA